MRSEGFPNPVRRTTVIWWVFCGLMLLGVLAPFLIEWFGGYAGDWAPPTMFSCLVVGITALVMAVIYTRRARLVGRMLRKESLLAHWKYDPVEWRLYAQKEHVENKREKKTAFILVSGISAVVGVILFLIYPDSGLLFLFVVMGIILVVGCAAFLAVWLRQRQNQTQTGEAFISPEGVYLNRELHVWRGFGAQLEGIRYQEESGSQPSIQITYSVPNRYDRRQVTVRVPVPRGAEEEAARVVEGLRAS